MRLADVPLPDNPACVHALEVAKAYSSPALVNHSIRSYVWAAAYATGQGIGFDDELLFVAALLHDLGLVEQFDNHARPFEMAGGDVAWVFAAGAGWPVPRRGRLAEVIVRHMWDEVDRDEDPEGFLLARSTAVDIAGRNADDFSAEFRAEVLAQYPRLTLAAEFVGCFEDQAKRKPDSSAAVTIGRGLATVMAQNPLEHL
ncbi:HD domain-containing protein [Amycolatopsis sp. NPDC023774]|uniref:HD domain-containing protein n=1 Tax=Amycolatopsis sp. NPDC023774 TaxID=3155015 RepID=UPI0033EE99F8